MHDTTVTLRFIRKRWRKCTAKENLTRTL